MCRNNGAGAEGRHETHFPCTDHEAPVNAPLSEALEIPSTEHLELSEHSDAGYSVGAGCTSELKGAVDECHMWLGSYNAFPS